MAEQGAKRRSQKPTAAELEILHILWRRGPSTVREVMDDLNVQKDLGYTGVLKLMQNMTAKGIVRRDESRRAHVYAASRPAEQTKRQLARDLLQRVFEGSTSQLMAHALDGRRPSRKEVEEIRDILRPYEEGGDD